MNKLHVFTTKGQPLTRYDAMRGIDEKPMWIKTAPLKRFMCGRCWQMKAAKNLTIQVYYDMSRVFCTKSCEPIKYAEKRRYWAREDYRDRKLASQSAKACVK